jgi:hypothetical protein
MSIFNCFSLLTLAQNIEVEPAKVDLNSSGVFIREIYRPVAPKSCPFRLDGIFGEWRLLQYTSVNMEYLFLGTTSGFDIEYISTESGFGQSSQSQRKKKTQRTYIGA